MIETQLFNDLHTKCQTYNLGFIFEFSLPKTIYFPYHFWLHQMRFLSEKIALKFSLSA